MQFFFMFLLWVVTSFNPSQNEHNNSNASSVKLIALNGKADGNKNILKWQTASEVNTREFIVETSADGKAFDLKAWITPKGTAQGPAFYTYADNASASRTHYRLRMVAADGKEQLSGIITITRTNK